MKRKIVFIIFLIYIVTLAGCKEFHRYENPDFTPAYVMGEVLAVYDESFLLRITDFHGCFFYDEEIEVHDSNTDKKYSIGDYVRIEYGGVLFEYDPPQVGAESITRIDGTGNK